MQHYLLRCAISIAMIFVFQITLADADQKTHSQVFVEVKAFHQSLHAHFPKISNNKFLELEKIDIDDATSSDVYFLAAALNEKLRILLAKNEITEFKQIMLSKDDITQVEVFELITVPAFGAIIENQEDVAGLAHKWLAYCLIALSVLHALAALKHHFINKDNTLNRIIGKRQPLEIRNEKTVD